MSIEVRQGLHFQTLYLIMCSNEEKKHNIDFFKIFAKFNFKKSAWAIMGNRCSSGGSHI